MTISIFTPVKNGGAFFPATCASIQNQSEPDWHHYILDSESTDGTSEFARSYAASDPRVRWVSTAQKGQYDALLSAIIDTDCDVVGWLNADDLYTTWALAAVKNHFAFNPESDWVTGMPALWDADGHLRSVIARAGYSRKLLRGGWYHDGLLGSVQQESIFFRKSLLTRLSAEDLQSIKLSKLAGDFGLWKAFAEFSKPDFLPTVLGGFRMHGSNRSTVFSDEYGRELREFGALSLPKWLSRKIRTAYDIYAAARTVQANRRTAEDIAMSTGSEAN